MKIILRIFLILLLVSPFLFIGKQEIGQIEVEQQETKGYVTFWFDDGLLSTHEIAYPILEEKGWKGVLAVIADRGIAMEKFLPEGDPIMSWNQVMELQNSGWEISNHSMTHANLAGKDSFQCLSFEILESKKILESYGLEIKSFTFPYGEKNREMTHQIVEENYLYWRSTISDINSVPPDRHIRTFFLTECADRDEIRSWIQKTEDMNGWLVIVLHAIIEEPIGWWQQTPDQFKMLIEEIERSDLSVEIPSEIFNRYD